MKTIQPVNIWNNGVVKSATKFNMNIVFDDLDTSATFYYELLSEGNEVLSQVAQGNLSLNGQQYKDWDGSVDAAYIWGASQLSLTII